MDKEKSKVQITEGPVYGAIFAENPKLAAEMATKAGLVRQIIDVKNDRKLTQQQLADLIGMSQPEVSRMLRGDFRNIAVSRIMYCLTLLDRDVRIVVERHSVAGKPGSIAVTTA